MLDYQFWKRADWYGGRLAGFADHSETDTFRGLLFCGMNGHGAWLWPNRGPARLALKHSGGRVGVTARLDSHELEVSGHQVDASVHIREIRIWHGRAAANSFDPVESAFVARQTEPTPFVLTYVFVRDAVRWITHVFRLGERRWTALCVEPGHGRVTPVDVPTVQGPGIRRVGEHERVDDAFVAAAALLPWGVPVPHGKRPRSGFEAA
jgi:hypothetical protein